MIRPFVPTDAAATAEMLRASFDAAYRGHAPDDLLDAQIARVTAADMRARLASHSAEGAVALVATLGDAIVGYASAGPSRDDDRDRATTGEVYSLYVAPHAWRSGVGRALQRECLEHLRTAGASRADLWVLADNQNAAGFYARTAWQQEGAQRVIDFLGGSAAVRYGRPLPEIRAFAPEVDARAVAEVHVAAWQDAYRGLMDDAYLDTLNVDAREQFWRDQPSGGTFVADLEGQVCGFVSVGIGRDEDAAATAHEVYAVNVRALAWGSGAGLGLLRTGEATLRTSGAHEATLWVLERNARARAFYEREGWVPDGAQHETTVGGARLIEVRHRKTLTPA